MGNSGGTQSFTTSLKADLHQDIKAEVLHFEGVLIEYFHEGSDLLSHWKDFLLGS